VYTVSRPLSLLNVLQNSVEPTDIADGQIQINVFICMPAKWNTLLPFVVKSDTWYCGVSHLFP
jgi:hypothetical protein